eukprot:Awhi_evm2s13731
MGNKIYPYPGLVNINLQKNGLTPEAAEMLCIAIIKNPIILQLQVGNNFNDQWDRIQPYRPIFERNSLFLKPILTWKDFEYLEKVEKDFPTVPQAVQIIHDVKEEIQEIFRHCLKKSAEGGKLNAMFTLPNFLRSKIFTKLSFTDLLPYCEACPSIQMT